MVSEPVRAFFRAVPGCRSLPISPLIPVRIATVEHHFGDTFETTPELEAPEGGRA